MNGVEINTRAYVATRLLLRWDYLYAVTLKTKVFGDYNHARLEVSWITSTRGLLLRGYTGARADWQACTTHAFLLDHRTSCTVFRAIVVFAMTIMARSFSTHLTSFVVHRVRFGPDSQESGPNPGTGLT